MQFWASHYFDLSDPINADIWARSPQLQQGIKGPTALAAEGAFGAQQAMLEPADHAVWHNLQTPGVLPWVPDLVGAHRKEGKSLLVVGLAYAGFIKEYSKRKAAMDLVDYANAATVVEFQERYIQKVVCPDHAYYRKLAELATLSGCVASNLCLTDLCRASLVKRVGAGVTRKDDSKERNYTASKSGRSDFDRYLVQNRDWTRSRLTGKDKQHVVTLGRCAELGLLRILLSDDWLASPSVKQQGDHSFDAGVVAMAKSLSKGPDWLNHSLGSLPRIWNVTGALDGKAHEWTLIAIPHPSAHGKVWKNSMNLAAHYLTQHLV